jgi:hypothetical protein
MPLIRAGAGAALHRHREVIAAGAAGAGGLWLAAQGGYFLVPLGLALSGLAAFWAVTALRRQRFRQGIGAPGMVEVDESQIGYLGPGTGSYAGGYVALGDLVELRLIRVHGARLWRLKQDDGQALLIPVAAAGSDRLFDAFAALPGIRMQALVEALQSATGEDQVVWRRDGVRGRLRLVRG